MLLKNIFIQRGQRNRLGRKCQPQKRAWLETFVELPAGWRAKMAGGHHFLFVAARKMSSLPRLLFSI
jgi:hypothetical protein